MTKSILTIQRSRRVQYVLFLCTCVLMIWSAPAVAEDVTFPMPEDYLPSGKISEYLKDATTYLERNASSKFAPRVALDILMVADNVNDAALSNMMKARLLFEHCRSLQGTYVVSSFEDAKEFRNFLLKQADVRLKKDPAPLPRQFTRAVESGLRHFKSKLLDDGPFLIRAYCLADAVGADRITTIVLPALRKESSDDTTLAAVVRICLDKQASASEKVPRLHGKGKDAAFLERFYLSTLSPAEKKQPRIIRILVENAITSRDYEKAHLVMKSMPQEDQNDPQVLFWKGWVLFALHKDQQALDVLNEIVQEHRKSKWAKTAKMYVAGIRNFTYGRKVNGETVFALSEALQDGIGILQANVRYNHDSDNSETQRYSIYIGIAPEESRLEVMLHKNNVLFLAYRSTDVKSAIYLKDDDKILAFRTPGPIPAPSLSLTRGADGKFAFQGALAMESSIKRAGAKTSSLFDSPFLSTLEGIQSLLDWTTRRQGWVPHKPVTTNGSTAFVWHIPSTTSPVMKQLEYRVSADNTFSYMKYGAVCIEDLKYGPKASFKLRPPPWPQCPIEENEKFEFGAMMKLMGTAMELLHSKK